MRIRLAMLVLAAAGMAFGAANSSNQADCLRRCTEGCKRTADTCKRNAKDQTAANACQSAHQKCEEACKNKTCTSQPGK